MKFHVKRSAFVQVFTQIARLVPKRGARPIFRRVLLVADETGVALETVVSEGSFSDGASLLIDSSLVVDSERASVDPFDRSTAVPSDVENAAGTTGAAPRDSQDPSFAGDEIRVRIDVPSDEFRVERSGKAVLNVKQIAGFLSRASEKGGETLEFEVVNRCLTVRSGDLSAEFNAGSRGLLEKFPEVAPIEDSRYFKLSAESLRRMIDRTVVVAKSKGALKAEAKILMNFDLSSSQFIFRRDCAIAAATDGPRLAIQNVASEYVSWTSDDGFQEKAVLFSSETLKVIRQFCSDATEARIAFDARSDPSGERSDGDREYARIYIGNVVISTTTSPGNFPCWRQCVPRDLPTRRRLDVLAADFAAAVFFLEEKEKNIRDDMSRIEPAVLKVSKNRLAIERKPSGAKIANVVEFPARYSGEPRAFMLDIRFLVDIVRHIPPRDSFRLYFDDKDVRTVFATDDGYRCAVLKILGRAP